MKEKDEFAARSAWMEETLKSGGLLASAPDDQIVLLAAQMKAFPGQYDEEKDISRIIYTSCERIFILLEKKKAKRRELNVKNSMERFQG